MHNKATLATIVLVLCLPVGCASTRAGQLNCATIRAPGDFTADQISNIRHRLGCKPPFFNQTPECRYLKLFENGQPLAPELFYERQRFVGVTSQGAIKGLSRSFALLEYFAPGDAAQGAGGDGSLPIIRLAAGTSQSINGVEELLPRLDQSPVYQVPDEPETRRLLVLETSADTNRELCGSPGNSSAVINGTKVEYLARVSKTKDKYLILMPVKTALETGPVKDFRMWASPLNAR